MSNIESTELLVIGSGPGGYTAAFRAADLGKKVTLVEYHQQIGGVCLNVGCIPSKALLHVAHNLEEAKQLKQQGIVFNQPQIDISSLRSWVVKNTINKLGIGLKSLAGLRKVNIITGKAQFTSGNSVQILNREQQVISTINFKQAIIAAGSRPIKLPNLPDDPSIMDSTSALELRDLPKDLLIIGGGIIGMELGTVYSALGTKVSVVELTKQLLPGADPDLVSVWQKRMQPKFDKIYLNSKVVSVESRGNSLQVKFAGDYNGVDSYSKILCAVGRRPNSDQIAADLIGLELNERGFIVVDQQMRTNLPHILAVGDLVGQPMLAHKAIPEGKIAAEVACGGSSYFDTKIIPSVAYTSPEVSWVGLTEEQCKLRRVRYEKAIFPWAASGRALATNKSDGLTKILFNPIDQQILGAGIVGDGSSELIGEMGLAMEMGATAKDLEAVIHPHPTLSETMVQSSEVFTGSITDLPNLKISNKAFAKV